VPGRRSADIGSALAQVNIGVGVGNFYAYRVIRALGIDVDDGAVRLSFVHYTSKDEVDRLIGELERCLN
jgi:selenocysteine lyase/cysteine desulfurase